MTQTLLIRPERPRFEEGRELLIVGLEARYKGEVGAGIQTQWLRFAPWLATIPGTIGHATYGVVWDADKGGGMSYLCGVEVADFADVPPELMRLRIKAQRYAVFQHRDHVSTVRQTWHAIWSQWLPASGHAVADPPDFERYDDRFNPRTGTGGFEIWIPLRS